MKKLATITLTIIIGMSMTLMPALAAENEYAGDAQTTAEDVLTQDGEAVAQDAEATEPTETEEPVEATEPTEPETQEINIDVTDGSALEGLDGLYISDIENDPELCYILDDPTFYRYYDVDENGLISKKQVELDEVEQFLANADANAEGIDDTANIDTEPDLTAMGGGVTGLGKGQTPAKYSSHNRYHCIDISWWQGKVSDANWQKIRAAGVTHAIIRCGYSTLKGGAHNTDSTFANNINGAYKAGIKVGVYYYSTAVTAAEAKSEAQYTASILASYKSKISLPVAFDYETGGRLTSSVMKKVGTASCIAFCDTIKASGYTPMVYANYNTLSNFIDYRTLQGKYKIWLANYTTNGVATSYAGDFYMWQYSSSGKVNGLSGNIDINYVFEPKTGSVPAVSTPASNAPKTATSASSFKAYTAKTTDAINYRTGPGTNYKSKGVYKKGTSIKVVGLSGQWAKLSNGYYVYLKYIKKVAAVSSVKYPYTAKTTTSVNYRTGPSTKYKVKGTYKKGVKVTIKSVKNGWGKMSNGYYIYLKFVKK
ncbi:MAG: hypothetical protein IJH05_08785 [Firmicutes bacterium]|nr:hypothetical protein [Bacillota bacterium]